MELLIAAIAALAACAAVVVAIAAVVVAIAAVVVAGLTYDILVSHDERFKDHGDAYFRFVTTPGIDPTNNLAEQALRFVVIDRRLTQGTRSVRGRQWCERIWTAAATCLQQGRSLFEYLCSATHAFLAGRPAPSLIPSRP